MINGKVVNIIAVRCRWVPWVGLALILCGLTAHAVQYVVPGGAGDQTGSSWANARADVQAAVDASELPGEEVWVAAGRYALAAPVALRSNSKVLGGFAGTESVASQRNWDTNVTILDGQDATQVVRMVEITDALFDGLVVTRGNVAVTNAMGGGGILIQGSKTCEVANCKVLHNKSVKSTGATACEGGGLYVLYSTNCVIDNCLFTDNNSQTYGSSLSVRQSIGIIITACRFIGCDNGDAAGVARFQLNTNLRFVNCLASGSRAYYGSFVYSAQDLNMINCTACFTTNRSTAGVLHMQSPNLIRNNVLAFNAPLVISEITTVTVSDPYVENNLFHAQTTADYYDHDQSLYFTGADALNNEIVPDRASGNVDGDPKFIRCPTVDDGTWTSIGAYDAGRAQTTLVNANAAFRPGSLKGLCLNPDTAETLYRHAEIADNTAASITVWGKVTWAAAGNGYRIYNFRLRQDSPAINAGLITDAPATDLDGKPRPSLGGIDIGAFEAQPPQGTSLLFY